MSLQSLLPIAPARVRALVLPVGQITRDRFASFVDRLSHEHVVPLRDITADNRPNRNMFSPLAFPSGAIFYDLITHVPPPSHLALAPFDLYREPLVIIAIADGLELGNASFSKRQSINSQAPTLAEANIRHLYQELEDLRDAYPKVLAQQLLVFDYTDPSDHPIPMPEGIRPIPPPEQCLRTTIKSVMCDVSSLLLAEMTALAKSFEMMTAIDSPGQAPGRSQSSAGSSFAAEDPSHPNRRNSQFAIPSITRSASSSGAADRNNARMSMPVPFKSLPFGSSSSSSSPGVRPTTPNRSGLSNPPTTFDDIAGAQWANTDLSSPERKGSRPVTAEESKANSSDRVSVQGFGPGGVNERWRNKGKGRATILIGSLYLQAGRWPDALKELGDGAYLAKSLNDHLWHGKALDLIAVCLMLLGWARVEFQVPVICLPPNEKPQNSAAKGQDSAGQETAQPKYLKNFQAIIPDLLERIVGLYSRISGEHLPPLPLSETIIRFCNTMTALHLCKGTLDSDALEIIVFGKLPTAALTTSPRLYITPTRVQITNLLFKAFPSSAPEVLTTVDRALLLSGIASVLGTLGLNRKKAMVVRELVSVLIGGLIEARTRGAAEVGIHPAAGLVALDAVNGHNNGAGALELGEGDIEQGVDAFLDMLSKTYGVVTFDGELNGSSPEPTSAPDTDAQVISRIQTQTAARQFGVDNIKLNILRACINFSEALPDFNGVLRFSSDLLRTAGSGVAPGPRREDAAPIISRDEQVRLVNNISKTSDLAKRLGLGHLAAEYWDEFLVRGIVLEPLAASRTPVPHAKTVLPGVTTARTSQDVNPFIYNPFLHAPDKATAESTLITGESASFKITLQNPYDIDVEVESIRLDTEGAAFESSTESAWLGPYRTQILRVSGTPKEPGSVKVTGAIVRIRGCRERRFPIFQHPWAPNTEIKVKGIGPAALEKSKALPSPGPPLHPESIALNAISAQPVVVVRSTTLPQSCVMILEGERQTFSITLQNLSTTTPADLLLFSFQDSTQGPLQTAIANRDATPAELYEYELALARKQALRLVKVDDSKRYIAPGGTTTFEFEILGRPGLTHGTVQVDYAHLGVPPSEVGETFHTRQVCLDMTVTVNASVELARMDILPIDSSVCQSLWSRAGVEGPAPGPGSAAPSPDDYCLLVLDLRNAWPSDMQLHLECAGAGQGAGEQSKTVVDERILPGHTNRVLVPMRRVHLSDPHASIPALNPSRQRQFVVSSRMTPEAERQNREAFWYREAVLGALSGSWAATTASSLLSSAFSSPLLSPAPGLSGTANSRRAGTLELRGIRLTPRMIDALRIDEVGIDVSVESAGGAPPLPPAGHGNRLAVDEFAQIRVRVTNRSSRPLHATVRVQPALRHRPAQAALDITRRLAWNGTLQQHLVAAPLLAAGGGAGSGQVTEVVIGATPLCRGEFEIAASVEETRLWTPEDDEEKKSAGGEGEGGEEDHHHHHHQQSLATRDRSDTDVFMDAMLGGARERRIWHSRRPCVVRVVDE